MIKELLNADNTLKLDNPLRIIWSIITILFYLMSIFFILLEISFKQ
jgi:hypothetical protein